MRSLSVPRSRDVVQTPMAPDEPGVKIVLQYSSRSKKKTASMMVICRGEPSTIYLVSNVVGLGKWRTT